MSLGSLGLKLSSMQQQKPTKKCDRCSLYYDEEEKKCRHCGELSDNELQQLLERIEKENISSSNVGKYFFVITILIAIGMLLFIL